MRLWPGSSPDESVALIFDEAQDLSADTLEELGSLQFPVAGGPAAANRAGGAASSWPGGLNGRKKVA